MANSDPGPEGEDYLDKGLSWDKRLELARARRAQVEAENGPTRLVPKLKPWEESTDRPAPIQPDQPLAEYPDIPPERQAAILARMRGDAGARDPSDAPAKGRGAAAGAAPGDRQRPGETAPAQEARAPADPLDAVRPAGQAKRLPGETGERAKRRVRPAEKAGRGAQGGEGQPVPEAVPVEAPPPQGRRHVETTSPKLPDTRRRTARPPSVPRPEVARELSQEPEYGPAPEDSAAVAALNRLLVAPPDGDDPRRVYGARFASIPPAEPKRRKLVWVVALACLLAGLLSGVLLAIALFFSIGSEVRAPAGIGDRLEMAEVV